MLRSILIFGLIAGAILALPTLWIIATPNLKHHGSAVFGYSVMLVAFSLIFVAIKRYRDRELGGVIKFLPALGIGLGISLIGGLIYVGVWDVYLYISHFGFADEWGQVVAQQALKHGATPAEAARKAAEFKANYLNPFWRWPVTLTEILPVAIPASLISAGLLRFRNFLPARGVAAS
jgi:hypothetical protein